jgi:ribosomal-protein-alanine N-acetyltransferase
MRLYTEKMNEHVSRDVLSWKYDEPYDFYNNELTPEAVSEMLDDSYFAVCDLEKGIVGFFCIGNSAQVPNNLYNYSKNFTDIGLGIKPELTGKGYGASFFPVVLSYIIETFGNVPIRLTVAKFNQRAIRLYKKFGSRQEAEFIKGNTEFITMILRHPLK